MSLRPEQLLVVNCPGEVDRHSIVQIRDFVAAGGSVFSTDGALRHVVEPAFPGLVATTSGLPATRSCGWRWSTATTGSSRA